MAKERNRPDLEDGFPAGFDHTDALFDEALRETFPASDPIVISAPKKDAMATAARASAQSTIYDSASVFGEHVLTTARVVGDNRR